MSTLLTIIVLASLTNGSTIQTAKAVRFAPKPNRRCVPIPSCPMGSAPNASGDVVARCGRNRRFLRKLQNGARRLGSTKPDECLGPRLPGLSQKVKQWHCCGPASRARLGLLLKTMQQMRFELTPL